MDEPLSMDQAIIRKLTDIVLKNIRNESFTVRNLSREAGMSRTTIHRKIKAFKNQDASQFIREIRLQRAFELLRQNAGTVSEVAFMVGFSSPGYFNRCFHEFFGHPPGKTKKDLLQKGKVRSYPPWKHWIYQKRPFWRTFILAVATILIFAIITSLGYTIIHDSSHEVRPSAGRAEKSIAVLPFKNLSDTHENQYFMDGIREDVLAKLSKVHDLRVISRQSTEQVVKNGMPVSEIAQKLHVNYIIEGSGQRYGNNFNLRIRLIDARDDREIMARSYQKKIQKPGELFRIQSHIAHSIASELEADINREEMLIMDKPPAKAGEEVDGGAK